MRALVSRTLEYAVNWVIRGRHTDNLGSVVGESLAELNESHRVHEPWDRSRDSSQGMGPFELLERGLRLNETARLGDSGLFRRDDRHSTSIVGVKLSSLDELW